MKSRREFLAAMGLGVGAATLGAPGFAQAQLFRGRMRGGSCCPPLICEAGNTYGTVVLPTQGGNCVSVCPLYQYAYINGIYYYVCCCCSNNVCSQIDMPSGTSLPLATGCGDANCFPTPRYQPPFSPPRVSLYGNPGFFYLNSALYDRSPFAKKRIARHFIDSPIGVLAGDIFDSAVTNGISTSATINQGTGIKYYVVFNDSTQYNRQVYAAMYSITLTYKFPKGTNSDVTRTLLIAQEVATAPMNATQVQLVGGGAGTCSVSPPDATDFPYYRQITIVNAITLMSGGSSLTLSQGDVYHMAIGEQ
jgi:hypothetical protein